MMKMLSTPIGQVVNLQIPMVLNIVLPWGYLVGQITANGLMISVDHILRTNVHMFVKYEYHNNE